jgi:preprotein translocase subunit SecY
MLSHIPVPLAEPTQLKQLINNIFSSQQLLGFFDLLSGGALSSLSIMLMGLGPYINASIIMQLLTKAFPKLEELQQDGESGRRKINQWTRMIAVPLAIVQSVGLILLIRQQAGGQSGVGTILPVKLITAGVIPIIFAVAFLSVPQFVGQLISSNSTPWIAELGKNLTIWFAQPGQQQNLSSNPINTYVYPLVYFTLIFVFTYFYTSIVFNAKEIAENLSKQGGFIENIRPGDQTQAYLSKIVSHLNLFGAASLGLLALLPLFVERILGTTSLTIGGTGLLIVVSVALETLRQFESRALMVTYDQDY